MPTTNTGSAVMKRDHSKARRHHSICTDGIRLLGCSSQRGHWTTTDVKHAKQQRSQTTPPQVDEKRRHDSISIVVGKYNETIDDPVETMIFKHVLQTQNKN